MATFMLASTDATRNSGHSAGKGLVWERSRCRKRCCTWMQRGWQRAAVPSGEARLSSSVGKIWSFLLFNFTAVRASSPQGARRTQTSTAGRVFSIFKKTTASSLFQPCLLTPSSSYFVNIWKFLRLKVLQVCFASFFLFFLIARSGAFYLTSKIISY